MARTNNSGLETCFRFERHLPESLAVVEFGRLRLHGFIGWLFWCVAHVYFLIGLRNRFIVAFSWLWSYLTFQRGARLIIGKPPDETQHPG